MSRDITYLIKTLTADKKRLFLIDGLGALLTAFCLGVVLAQFESSFGMPKKLLYSLATVACGFAMYSLCCHFFVVENREPYLKGIAIANLLYCCATIVVVFVRYQDLTVLGLGYFLIELIVIGCLIVVESKAVSVNRP